MSPWIPRAVILAATMAMMAIRTPHGQRSRGMKVVVSRRGAREIALLALAWLAFFVPVIWMFLPQGAPGDYPLHPVPLAAGTALLAAGLWVLARSHADLGTNWSITLEIREGHRLVSHGIYRRVRHPMYAAFFLYSIGQALVLPNWIAGPSYLVAFTILYVLRVGAEERMMLEQFGDEYRAYMARTKRLIPGVI